MTKVLVIGIDAKTWSLIEPWARGGKLPTMRRLMENSVWGDLKSCIHYFTSPAWKCYSTGKNPGKLGACGWWDFCKAEKKLSLVSSLSFKSKELWDILGEHGYKCGIVNMPLTFPPKKINGVLISGFLSAEEEYVQPPELEQELKKYNYAIYPKMNEIIYTEKALLERKSLIKSRFLISEKLLKQFEFDFFQLVVFSTDEIQHFFWKYMEEGDEEYGNVIEEFYQLVDLEIGRLLDKVDDECYTFIISDHGATALKGTFGLNTWLRREGYLHLRSKNIPYRFIVEAITKILPHQIVRKFAQRMRAHRGKIINILFQNVDWEKTKAICIDHNLIYIANSNDLQGFRKRLIHHLKGIRNPKTGEKAVRDVRTKEEAFKGECLDSLPDLIVIPEDGYRFCGFPRDGGTKSLWDFSRRPCSGWHSLHGVFLAHGSDIKKGERIENAEIYDLVPTILHIFGVPIPSDIDGRVLKEIFEEKSDLAKRPVIRKEKGEEELSVEDRHYSTEEEKMAVERLKSLGYL